MEQYGNPLYRTRGFGYPLVALQLMLTSASNLMAPDEFKNLGFAEDAKAEAIPNHAGGATAHKVRDDGKKMT